MIREIENCRQMKIPLRKQKKSGVAKREILKDKSPKQNVNGIWTVNFTNVHLTISFPL